MKIGNIEIDSMTAGLAPMAGVADMAFRELCVEYGATYVVSEMVSSKGLTMCDRKSRKLLALSDNERPAAVQIFGCDEKIMAKSAVECLSYNPDVIDINMGCPAPKIVSSGGGAALLKNPELAESIIRAVVESVDIPVTVKIRLGWDDDSINAVEMAQRAQKAGAAAITIHGRTRGQMYQPPVDIAAIAEVKRNVDIPVIANGDIVDGVTAARMIEETNCDFILVGRGALGRPWVFSQISAYLKHQVILPEPPMSERMRVMVKHIKRICDYKGEAIGIREARKHASWYIRDFHSAAKLRQKAGTIKTLDDLERLAFEVASMEAEKCD